ncbi:MAG TPA: lytic murein transglycosylase [Campylobacterales bacterium]|nr:lytic murein transglycosylase [Campylobacterales bacterium]
MIRVFSVALFLLLLSSCAKPITANQELFLKAKFKPNILKIYNSPISSYKSDASWTTYKKHILTNAKLKRARKFLVEYKDTLSRAENIYHVEKEYIAAFIAIESDFGNYTGESNIFDALTTLAFHKNRKQDFFKYELDEFLTLSDEKGWNPLKQYGSFAGAMGCVQQLPSVHRKYGVDFNNDGKKDLFDLEDCIGTIANFMYQNGWEVDRQVAIRASFKGKRYKGLETGYNKIYSLSKLKNHGINPRQPFTQKTATLLQLRDTTHHELWLGLKNMQIITTYNNSTNYGMAIYKFATKLQD